MSYNDSHLNWKKHISYVTFKLRTISFVLFKASKVLDCRSLKIPYFSLFYPHIDYCCEVWGNTYKSNIHSLFLLQKKSYSYYNTQ